MTNETHWEALKVDPDYDICVEYPYQIRRRDNHMIVSESNNSNGYIRLALNRISYLKHRLVALQWIDNDDPTTKTEVDHVNKDRTDYHVDNLRWVTPSQNSINLTGRGDINYQYFNDIPDDSIVIDTYETRNGVKHFEPGRYYYYRDEVNEEDVFYGKVADELYRRLHVNVMKNRFKMVSCMDVDNNQVSVYVNKFKRQYNL